MHKHHIRCIFNFRLHSKTVSFSDIIVLDFDYFLACKDRDKKHDNLGLGRSDPRRNNRDMDRDILARLGVKHPSYCGMNPLRLPLCI